MYYIPKVDNIVLENMFTEPIFLMHKGKVEHSFMPGERKTFTKDEIKLYDDERYGRRHIHMGMVHMAVEVDGKRYEYPFRERRDEQIAEEDLILEFWEKHNASTRC